MDALLKEGNCTVERVTKRKKTSTVIKCKKFSDNDTIQEGLECLHMLTLFDCINSVTQKASFTLTNTYRLNFKYR